MVLPTKFLKQTKQLELTMAQMSQDCLKRIVVLQARYFRWKQNFSSRCFTNA